MSNEHNCDDEEKEIDKLLQLVKSKEEEIRSLKSEITVLRNSGTEKFFPCNRNVNALGSREIERYSRQILIPEFGVQGQTKLKYTSMLVIGAGGLGCPAATYLAAAGVGTIGIVDYDTVEISNLHRQVSHTEMNLGVPKCVSLINSLKSVNSLVHYVPYNFQLKSENIKDVLQWYDIVIDASDNVPTRYLLNDACVFLKKPLVSGSALRLEGQLTIYNFGEAPCYRCLYPSPPIPSATTNCSDAGVLGPVTGVIGSLQALEAIKIAIGMESTFKNKLLVFDGECATFRTFNLRGKNPSCQVCGQSPTITDFIDYEAFCQTSAVDKCYKLTLLPDSDRITCMKYKKIVEDDVPHVLIDVRPSYEFDICSLPNSINFPFNEITSIQKDDVLNVIRAGPTKHIYIICRRGNDSQRAVQFLRGLLPNPSLCCDIKGGLQAWHHEVDNKFPLY